MPGGQPAKVYDLEERTGKFGESVIEFARTIPKEIVTIPLIGQLVRAGTSVGSNYCEADCAESRRDFEHKLGICAKEAKETMHWLRMIARAVPALQEGSEKLRREVNELRLIFISIIRKTRSNERNSPVGDT